jgi:hypothetical protein
VRVLSSNTATYVTRAGRAAVVRQHAGLVEPSDGAGYAAARSGFEEVDLDGCDGVPGVTVQG